ncbi:MAG: ThuA domain-containing protein [Halobacteriales archaeon]
MAAVTVWNEYRHERNEPEVRELYPEGIHAVIADALAERGHETRTATLDEPEHGLTEEVLADTDVLTWWSHAANDEVEDEIVDRVIERVHDGMGLIVLHAGKNSKVFGRLMGTTRDIKYREAAETQRLWVVEPGHPIADGLEEYIELPETEMYGEPYGIPQPDELVFVSWFEGGEVFRSGCCYRRERGKVFAFQPGHEEYPVYHEEEVLDVIDNAVEWATPEEGASYRTGESDPIEDL